VPEISHNWPYFERSVAPPKLVLIQVSCSLQACKHSIWRGLDIKLTPHRWYTRRQQPIRIGIWYTANGLGIACGGLLGYGIGHIKGHLPSWKYEFLIIGALCSVWGIVLFFFLPDSPVTAPLLSKQERRWAVERLRENQTGVENKHLKGYQVKEAFKDYKLYLFYALGVVGNIPNGGISNFGTIIIKGFGFSTLVTTLMQVPYGIFIGISILSCVFVSSLKIHTFL
jgi:MFS family permease